MPTPLPLGQVIRDLREARGLNQTELAEAAGIVPSYVSLLEAGKRPNVSFEIVSSIARALDVTPGELWRRATQIAEGEPQAPSEHSFGSDTIRLSPEQEAIVDLAAKAAARVTRQTLDQPGTYTVDPTDAILERLLREGAIW